MSDISEITRKKLAAQTVQGWCVPGVTDLGIGQPQDSILPLDIMRSAAAEFSTLAPQHSLQYGNELGDGYLRLALAEFLSEHYASPVNPELLFISNGNSQAIDLVCSVFTKPGDVVFVEEPSYFLAIDIFRHHQLQIVGIPVDEQGLSIEALELALRRQTPAFIYTIPAFHNPTGVSLSQERRMRLLELAVQFGFLIVADEVYQLLDYAGDEPIPMAAHIGSGKVLSLGTFSKILAPGLRLGWIQADVPLIARLAKMPYVVSGGGLNPFASSIVRTVIEKGWLAEYVQSLRVLFGARVEVMNTTLRRHFPESVSFQKPKGGYFFWLRFPQGTDTARFLQPALDLRVGFRAGPKFSVSDAQHECIRLSFAYYDAATLETAIPLLARAMGFG